MKILQTQPNHLTSHLLLQAPNNRHGIALEPQQAVVSQSDVPDIIHVGVPGSITAPWESAAGGIGLRLEDAQLAAIGEAIERYCATIISLPLRLRSSIADSERIDAEAWCLFTPEQRKKSNFPFENIYSESCKYTNVFDFQSNREIYIPHPLVALRDTFQTGVPTSSGLAAGSTASLALLRGIQELIERDALMITWLHSVAARSVALPAAYASNVERLGGDLWAFDLSPAYSPFPVAAIAGGIPKRGKWRYSLGVACRETWEEAVEKAYLEWNQGVLFAGIYESLVDTSTIKDPYYLKSFDEHAIFYTLHPDSWHSLPLFSAKEDMKKVSLFGTQATPKQALIRVKKAFKKHGIRLLYRDLTTIDARQLGLHVVRATSPDLAPIFAHQEWPLIGGVETKLASRYPWAQPHLAFPNKMPHPLG